MRWLLLLILIASGCSTINFPIGQKQTPGMNSAIQQELLADAIEAAVEQMQIEPEALYESTACIKLKSPFEYGLQGDGEDSGLAGYLRTMVEKKLTERGFHIVSSDVNPDHEITLDIRTAGAEVEEEDMVVMQKGTLNAHVSFRLYIKDHNKTEGKPYFIAEGSAVSDPYIWRHTILYFIGVPGVKYRAHGEPTFWGRIFSLSNDAGTGVPTSSNN